MNATDFFTRRILGMDYRVWGALLLTYLLSLGLCGYKQIRLNTVNDQLCPTDTIAINGKKVQVVASCYVNRYSLFAVQSEEAATVVWEFGDGIVREKGQIVSHKFTKEGTYIVTAKVNRRCEFKAVIVVMDDPFRYQEKPAVEIFADPMRPPVGSAVKFYCVSDVPFISSYEWIVVETKEVQKDAVPVFTFGNYGNYTIQLVINNDPSKTWTTVIQVSAEGKVPETFNNGDTFGGGERLGPLVTEQLTPFNSGNDPSKGGTLNENQGAKPDSPREISTTKAPEVEADAFRDLLQNVVNQEGKELEDLYEYLDYKATTMVEVNKNTLIPLKDFCKNMRNKKKKQRKIESLSFKRDDKKSIQVIQVKVPEKGGFLDWLNPFN